ncbi:hypothetical protein P153DRAFT_377233 [Dothidotthia symphoricarpi CBS 119687]|uniref:DUF7082 domain-containing protein n=1 Tax=Dothidotthia symphoricarpi CBS 119687 TaxID=1392245 RepID=A0A6A6A917_9PLEO|nr:uncharacterized protein P153DRAFT_377233 [Dothidotthia symphoricarpi CBS 119687]KAF2127685.1 hypothetical protein P153DRAFT_377233 [Dothidotthia symphoricarpi CBS 119687]
MSTYARNQHFVCDAEATRSNQAPIYPVIAQPSSAPQYTDAPARLTHEPSSAGTSHIPSLKSESRGTGDHQPDSSFIDARSRHPATHAFTETETTGYVTPKQGIAGSTISLQLRTNYDLAADRNTFILMFGSKKCVAALEKVEYDDEWYNYVLNVEVPPFPLTNSWDPTMMLKLQVQDRNGNIRQSDAGNFTFTDMSPNLAYQSSPEFARKRKYSTEYGDSQDYSENTDAKRVNSLHFDAKRRSMSRAYSGAQVSPLPAQSSSSVRYAHADGYGLSKQTNYASQLLQKGLYAIPSDPSMTQGEFKTPQMSPGLQSYTQYNPLSHTGRGSAPIAAMPSIMPSPAVLQTPILVRATALPQAGSASSSQAFNPYSLYQTKAVLRIEGDLGIMSEGWTQGELDAKRRLVRFERSQNGSTIETSFSAVTPETLVSGTICVSCIWWEDKNECFITSVDAIYLLEKLVNVRFTVEEKNRIRRNLEGFRPLTVSKAKSDSEGFFKTIMGFPKPKPRNIEKDVKVFPWKILAHALKKIIGKYSASYSSTAGIGSLPIASTSSYVPNSISQAAGAAHRNASSRSGSGSITSNSYTPNMTSTSLSPHLKVSAGLEGSAGHGMPVPPRTPTGQSMTHWGTAPPQMSQYPTVLAQAERGSWDYGYLHGPTTTRVPNVTQSLQMQQSDVKPVMRQLSVDNSYQQYGQLTTRV